MTLTPPENVDYGRVEWQVISDIADGPDVGDTPDYIAPTGTVTFTASTVSLRNNTSTPNPKTIARDPITGILDSEGYLCTIDKTTGEPAYRGIELIATDDADLNPVDWVYNVTYNVRGNNGRQIPLKAHQIYVPAGETVDLTTVGPVDNATAIGIPQAEALAAQAAAAAASASAAASQALAAAEAAEAALVDSDTFVAEQIETPGTATREALTAHNAEQIAAAMNVEVDRADATYATPAGVVPIAQSAAADYLATDPGVADAAAAAVDGALEDATILRGATPTEQVAFAITDADGRRSDLELGADGAVTDRVMQRWTERVGEGIGLEFASSEPLGVALAAVDALGRRSDLEIGLDGHTPQRVIDLHAARYADHNALPKDRVWVPDAIHEWWIGPMAFYTDEPYFRLLGGAVSADGTQVIYEATPGAGSRSVPIWKTDPDDHSVPTPFMAGKRVCAVSTEHGRTNGYRFVIGNPDGSIESLRANAPIFVELNASPTFDISYSQVIALPHLDTSTTRTFWSFCRYGGDAWAVTEFTVDLVAATVSVAFTRTIVQHGGRQVYISLADAHAASGNQKIRCAFGYNPGSPDKSVWYFEIDTVTGALTSPISGGPSGNIRTPTGLPINLASSPPTAALPQPTAGTSRRLTYVRPGPYKPGILYAEWSESAPDDATYKVADIDAATGAVAISDYGSSGPRVGYTAVGNYVGMGGFPNPAHDDTVAFAHRAADGSRSDLVVYRSERGTRRAHVVATDKDYILRPWWPVGAGPFGVLYSHVHTYSQTSYQQYGSDIRSAREDR